MLRAGRAGEREPLEDPARKRLEKRERELFVARFAHARAREEIENLARGERGLLRMHDVASKRGQERLGALACRLDDTERDIASVDSVHRMSSVFGPENPGPRDTMHLCEGIVN